jgi:hypothetical protein
MATLVIVTANMTAEELVMAGRGSSVEKEIATLFSKKSCGKLSRIRRFLTQV